MGPKNVLIFLFKFHFAGFFFTFYLKFASAYCEGYLEKKLQNATNLLIIASQRSTSCEILLILKFLLKQGLSTRRPRRRPLLLLWDLIALQLLLPAPKSKKKSLYTEKCHSKHIAPESYSWIPFLSNHKEF